MEKKEICCVSVEENLIVTLLLQSELNLINEQLFCPGNCNASHHVRAKDPNKK